MLDRAKQLTILVESNRRNLREIDLWLEELESGDSTRTSYSSIRRGFHTIKHDARHLELGKLADLAGAAESIVELASDHKLGLPIDLLRAASEEISIATETLAAGGRHRLNKALLVKLRNAATASSAE